MGRKEEEKRDGGPISRYGGRTYGKLCGAHGESDEDDGRKVVAQALGGPENHKGEQEKLQTEVATHAGKPGNKRSSGLNPCTDTLPCAGSLQKLLSQFKGYDAKAELSK